MVQDGTSVATIFTQTAGKEFKITVTGYDRFGNLIDEFNEFGELTDLTATISPSTAKFTCGVWAGSVTITKATIATTIFIASQGKRGTSNPFQVLHGDVAGFEFGTIATQLVRKPFGISMRALDEFDNTADYNGTVSLTDTTDSIKTTAQFRHGILTATVTITKSMPDVVITVDHPIIIQSSNPFFVLIDHTKEEKIGIPQEIELRMDAYFLPADYYPVITKEPHEVQINIASFYHDQGLTTKRLFGTIYKIEAFDEQENPLIQGYGTGSFAFIDISYDKQALGSIKEDTLRVYKLRNNRWVEIPDSVVDVIGNIVRAKIDGLGVFMLSGAITPQDLSILVVYPNPFKPSRGDKCIYFEGLPANSRIRIYDISGHLIKEAQNQEAIWEWDVQDNYGKLVDSGIYIYIVTTEGENGLKKIGKIAVIR
ncbi:MAG: T9SS type A sorting domain-containing protein [bacterium]|nr:T9SS type A sorting domain-containing protein [bacterium]